MQGYLKLYTLEGSGDILSFGCPLPHGNSVGEQLDVLM